MVGAVLSIMKVLVLFIGMEIFSFPALSSAFEIVTVVTPLTSSLSATVGTV